MGKKSAKQQAKQKRSTCLPSTSYGSGQARSKSGPAEEAGEEAAEQAAEATGEVVWEARRPQRRRRWPRSPVADGEAAEEAVKEAVKGDYYVVMKREAQNICMYKRVGQWVWEKGEPV